MPQAAPLIGSAGMPRFHFELIEDGAIAQSHCGLELHEIAVDELDLAVDLAHLLAKRAAESTMGPVTVTISDEAKRPFARVRLMPKNDAPSEGPAANEAALPPVLYLEEVPRSDGHFDERVSLRV
jgi:hypothetical protein